MKKNALLCLLALGVTALLILAVPRLTEAPEAPRDGLRITRVWITETEPAASAWLRERAAAWTRATGKRVYLRSAGPDERNRDSAVTPDLIVSAGEGVPAALRGYALIVRDDGVSAVTPAPTSALFFRPSATPGPTAVPAPAPDMHTLSAVLSPRELMNALPGTVLSADPAADFSQGKAAAALLTAGQAEKLSVGFRAYSLPDGAGFLTVGAQAYSEDGQRFLSFLLSEGSQRALARQGLYSPYFRLYGGDDPLRGLIEAGLPFDRFSGGETGP